MNTNNTQPDDFSSDTDIPLSHISNEFSPEKHASRPKKRVLFPVCIAFAALFVMIACGICGAVVYRYFFEGGGYINSYPKTYLPGAYSEYPATDNGSVGKIASSGTQSARPVELTVEEIAEKVTPSIVAVVSELGDFSEDSNTGSGIIMSSDGYIITNYHVIEGSNAVRVILDNGQDYLSSVIGSDQKTDIAVLKISAPELRAAEFGNSDELKQGSLAVAIGNPFGIELQGTVTQGCISAINRSVPVGNNTMTLIQTDASINPGNSGGALVNKYGQVVGVNSVKLGIAYYEGLGFAIPINTVKPIAEELIQYGYIKGRPALGISGSAVSARAAAFYGVPQGILVRNVYSASDANEKGIQDGDIITHINETRVYSSDDISLALNEMSAGDTVSVRIFRNQKTFTLDVQLMDEANVSV